MITKKIATLLLLILVFTSCKKYPEGPSLSFRSKTARVSNTWKVEKVLMNGNDVTSAFLDISYTETYDKDGNYSYNSTQGNGAGKWTFQNNDLEIKRSGVSGQSTEDLTILLLKEKSFWYSLNDGSDSYEFHFIEN